MVKDLKNLKIALVHDYLLRYGGAERVLAELHTICPDAPIYTLIASSELTKKYFPGADIHTSFMDRLPAILKKHYKFFAPLLTSAAESFDLSQFDLVISSSSAFVKGVITRPDTMHVSYCHTPTRFLWDWTHEYLSSTSKKKRGVARLLLHFLRIWDFEAAQRPDFMVANSLNVQKRIAKFYRRSARVIYPPVSIKSEIRNPKSLPRRQAGETNSNYQNSKNSLADIRVSNSGQELCTEDSYFLIVSYLQKYKSIDVAVSAFNKLGYPLLIIGDGPERKHLEKMALPNIKFLGWQEDAVVGSYLRGCKAFVFPTDEDFGIAPVEAMLAGKPVVALRRGGALEYVQEGLNGEFFDDLHPAVLADGVRRMVQNYSRYDPALIKNSAARFSPERFRSEMREYLLGLMEQKGVV